VTGPLAQQFAQVRQAILCTREHYETDEVPCAKCDSDADGLSALSVIERHVQDTEKRVEKLHRLMIAAYFETAPADEEAEAFLMRLEGIEPAALPAREKGTE
jgi:hypothetical protein